MRPKPAYFSIARELKPITVGIFRTVSRGTGNPVKLTLTSIIYRFRRIGNATDLDSSTISVPFHALARVWKSGAQTQRLSTVPQFWSSRSSTSSQAGSTGRHETFCWNQTRQQRSSRCRYPNHHCLQKANSRTWNRSEL